MNTKEKIIWLVRVLLGIIFIYASISKIRYPEAFAEAVFNYQILPHQLVNITAIILPWLELVTGVCLVVGKWVPGSLVIINGLMLIFMSALIFNLSRGLNIHCGCFSVEVETIEGASMIWIVIRDLIFFGAALFLLVYEFVKHRRESEADVNITHNQACVH